MSTQVQYDGEVFFLGHEEFFAKIDPVGYNEECDTVVYDIHMIHLDDEGVCLETRQITVGVDAEPEQTDGLT
jgi:hypothetical protein